MPRKCANVCERNVQLKGYHRLTDVTALWNTNAFFAYVLSVKLLGLNWEPRRLAAVLVATAGSAVVVYGSTSASESEDVSTRSSPSTGPLVGDSLTLVASIIYGIYQVLYKIYAALPTDPTEFDVVSPVDAAYEPIAREAEEAWDSISPSDKGDMVYPTPFGLYANFLTSSIGVCTFLLLWTPIPILHVLELEKFRLPTDITTISVIAAISLSGVVFNAGLMVWCTSLLCAQSVILTISSDPAWSMGTYCHVCRKSADNCPSVFVRHHIWACSRDDQCLESPWLWIYCGSIRHFGI